MPDVIKSIIEDLAASASMDVVATTAFMAGLSAGITIGKIAGDPDEQNRKQSA